MLGTPPSNSSEDNNNKYLPVIGSACGAGFFAVLAIIVAVSCIVVMIHHKNKENKKESVNTSLTEANKIIEPIYDTPNFLIAPSKSHTVVLVNPTHELNTGEARAATVMNLDTQDHRASHSSNCNTTSIKTNHYSAHLYKGRVTTTTTIATENIIEGNVQVDTTSDDHTDIVDESHTTTCSSQLAETNEQIEYAPITSPSSDVFPVVNKSRTSKVSCSTQAFNGVKPTGGDECATINQQQNLNCDASVNQVHDAQLSHADNNAGSNVEGM